MANMSYCRFQNTRLDMEDCLDALREEKPLSRDEANAGRWMIGDILAYCRDNGIIDSYNGPRDSDHGWQKEREHGRISESTERGNEPWHEQRTARSTKQNWSWRY